MSLFLVAVSSVVGGGGGVSSVIIEGGYIDIRISNVYTSIMNTTSTSCRGSSGSSSVGTCSRSSSSRVVVLVHGPQQQGLCRVDIEHHFQFVCFFTRLVLVLSGSL